MSHTCRSMHLFLLYIHIHESQNEGQCSFPFRGRKHRKRSEVEVDQQRSSLIDVEVGNSQFYAKVFPSMSLSILQLLLLLLHVLHCDSLDAYVDENIPHPGQIWNGSLVVQEDQVSVPRTFELLTITSNSDCI